MNKVFEKMKHDERFATKLLYIYYIITACMLLAALMCISAYDRLGFYVYYEAAGELLRGAFGVLSMGFAVFYILNKIRIKFSEDDK